MQKPTPGQRRAAYMRTIRRADYAAAKEHDAGVVHDYEVKLYARRSKVTVLEIDDGSAAKVSLPVIIVNGLK